MALSFDKLLSILQEREISIYKLKSDKVIGTATLDKIRSCVHMGKNSTVNIDTRSIDSICNYLNCQPGDIMEYLPDEQA